MSLGKCFDLQGDLIIFGDVEESLQNIIVSEFRTKFGSDCEISSIEVDRVGRTYYRFQVGIDELQADEACDFADELAKKHSIYFCFPSEIGS